MSSPSPAPDALDDLHTHERRPEKRRPSPLDSPRLRTPSARPPFFTSGETSPRSPTDSSRTPRPTPPFRPASPAFTGNITVQSFRSSSTRPLARHSQSVRANNRSLSPSARTSPTQMLFSHPPYADSGRSLMPATPARVSSPPFISIVTAQSWLGHLPPSPKIQSPQMLPTEPLDSPVTPLLEMSHRVPSPLAQSWSIDSDIALPVISPIPRYHNSVDPALRRMSTSPTGAASPAFGDRSTAQSYGYPSNYSFPPPLTHSPQTMIVDDAITPIAEIAEIDSRTPSPSQQSEIRPVEAPSVVSPTPRYPPVHVITTPPSRMATPDFVDESYTSDINGHPSGSPLQSSQTQVIAMEKGSPDILVVSAPSSPSPVVDDTLLSGLVPDSPASFEHFKYHRTVLIPDDPDDRRYIQEVEPVTFQFARPNTLPPDWRRCTNPQGHVYFYNNKKLYTDSPMDDEETAKDVEYFANVIRAQFSMASWAGPPDTEIALHLMRSSEGEVECHYYLASWTFRSIFWLKKVPVGLITGTSLSHVVSQAHLGIAFGAQFWKHVEIFSVDRMLTSSLLTELRDHLTYGWSDAVTSEVSTFPFDPQLSENILRCIGDLKAGRSNEFHTSALARYMHAITWEMFRNYHGEPVVRLSRNESVHELPGNRKRTFFFQILSTLLFTMPSLYLGELEKVWVDDTVAYHPWRNFQAEMKKDWANSITPATVLLSANVGFLAIQSIDNLSGSSQRSFAQIAAYISALLSLFNYITVQILALQHRGYIYEAADTTVRFILAKRTNGRLEVLAVTFSIPTGLFIWSMLAFLAAILFALYHHTAVTTRVLLGIVFGLLLAMTAALLYLDRAIRVESENDVAVLLRRLTQPITNFIAVFDPKQPRISPTAAQPEEGSTEDIKSNERHQGVGSICEESIYLSTSHGKSWRSWLSRTVRSRRKITAALPTVSYNDVDQLQQLGGLSA